MCGFFSSIYFCNMRTILACLFISSVWPALAGRNIPSSAERARAHIEQRRRQTDDTLLQKRPPQKYMCNKSSCFYPGVRIHMSDGQGISACRDCEDPGEEGIYVETWESAYRPLGYALTAELVYAVPNDAHKPLVNNVKGSAVMIDRGNVSFAMKAKHAVDAGAVAVIIRDDGSCGDDFDCGTRLGSKRDGDLAAKDSKVAWEGVKIPVVLVTKLGADRLSSLMILHSVQIDGMGTQLYCAT